MTLHQKEHGAIDRSLIAIISLIILTVATGSLAAWAYAGFVEQKTNVDGKINLAVATAKKEQADADEAKFAEREKEPNRQFAGPDDYGRLTFNYPKTWSVYEATDVSAGSGSSYEAYLNPISVPPVGSSTQQYALRVTIEQTAYDQIIQTYQPLVQKGDLKTSSASSNGHSGTRLDGIFDDGIRGAAVLYKIRDKTVTLRTDADTFKPDFDALVKTIDFKD